MSQVNQSIIDPSSPLYSGVGFPQINEPEDLSSLGILFPLFGNVHMKQRPSQQQLLYTDLLPSPAASSIHLSPLPHDELALNATAPMSAINTNQRTIAHGGRNRSVSAPVAPNFYELGLASFPSSDMMLSASSPMLLSSSVVSPGFAQNQENKILPYETHTMVNQQPASHLAQITPIDCWNEPQNLHVDSTVFSQVHRSLQEELEDLLALEKEKLAEESQWSSNVASVAVAASKTTASCCSQDNHDHQEQGPAEEMKSAEKESDSPLKKKRGRPGRPKSNVPARIFKCEICENTFSRKHDLKRHSLVHTGLRPFTCQFCTKSFSRPDALHRHVEKQSCRGLKGMNFEQALEFGFMKPAGQNIAETGNTNQSSPQGRALKVNQPNTAPVMQSMEDFTFPQLSSPISSAGELMYYDPKSSMGWNISVPSNRVTSLSIPTHPYSMLPDSTNMGTSAASSPFLGELSAEALASIQVRDAAISRSRRPVTSQPSMSSNPRDRIMTF